MTEKIKCACTFCKESGRFDYPDTLESVGLGKSEIQAEPKYPDLYACWDREDQKIMCIDDDLNRLYEMMSYGGYASRVRDNHPGFDILRYTLLGPVK